MWCAGVAVLGLAALALAVWALVAPRRLMGWIDSVWARGDNLVWIAVLRFAAGGYLILASSRCREPDLVFGMGILFVAAAAGLVLLGRERAAAWMAWWQQRPDAVIRSLSFVWGAFGLFLVHLGR